MGFHCLLRSSLVIDTFVPNLEPQTELVLHMRKALRADQVEEVAGLFLWLSYSILDVFTAGLSGVSYIIMAPTALLLIGPDATFALGWYIREALRTRCEVLIKQKATKHSIDKYLREYLSNEGK